MRHVWNAAPATQNDDRDLQNAARATKTATHLGKTSQKYCACHTKRLSTRYKTLLNVRKCHACTRNEATPHVKPPKVTPFAELTIGTAIRPSRDGCERLRTNANVADGCGRLRTVGQRRANTLNPQTPRVKREPLLRIREGNQPINHNKSRKCSMSCETLKLLYSKMRSLHSKSTHHPSLNTDAT